MNKRVVMGKFINEIVDCGLMTAFIKNIFDYDEFNDYNYLFRMKEIENKIIIDIYDNISDNRFNRYIFSFSRGEFDVKVVEDKNVFVTYINVYNVYENNNNNKLLKLAYLFKLNSSKMIMYSETFLNREFVEILKNVLNKPIYQ